MTNTAPGTILLTGNSFADQNLYYKTHFLAGDDFVYLEHEGQGTLITGAFERARAEKESSVSKVRTVNDYGYTDLVRELNNQEAAFAAMLVHILDDVGATSITVEGTFPVLYAEVLKAEGYELNIVPALYSEERRCKSPQEIEAIEHAQRATERATLHAINIIAESNEYHGVLHYGGIPLTSERLRSEIEILLLRENMDTAQSPIVAGGPGAADPHWLGSGPLQAGEAIVLDIFPRSKGSRYFADMTRTVVKGKPDKRLRVMYDTVLQAQEAALHSIRPGISGQEVHEAVKEIFARAGFTGPEGPQYIHGTGHGVGLDIHEGPSLGNLAIELRENDVVTVEPGLYDPELGGVRIEDLVVVTASGCRNLTHFPKHFEV